MELDYFSLYLRNYLRDHGFSQSELDSPIIAINADSAARTYEEYRKSGANVDGSNEAALGVLFIGVGLSKTEVATDMLEEEFKDRINIDEPMVLDFWSQKIADEKSIWDSLYKDGELGLNKELVDEGKDLLLVRINQFLNSHVL